jgi:regulator of protease activity HflC (stomatin/prohibitin superfamily)
MSVNLTTFRDATQANWRSIGRKLSYYRGASSLTLLVLLFLLLVCWPWIVITVPAGHVAVRWWRLFGGTDISRVYDEGSYFNFPWDEMPIYDVRIQTISGDFDVLTSDGMMMHVDVALRIRLNRDTVGLLHKNVGPGYAETLVRPALGTYVRAVFSRYAAEEAYGIQRLAIQEQIRKAVTEDLAPRLSTDAANSEPGSPSLAAQWISVQDVLIRSIKFPDAVEAAINRKIEQYEVKQEYRYRLEREQLESQRRQVEAQGIAKFQQIVGAGLTDAYLRWKGIEATLALAQSPNSKIVVIGTPRDGMPLILGGADGAESATSLSASSSDRSQPAVSAPQVPSGAYAGKPAH